MHVATPGSQEELLVKRTDALRTQNIEVQRTIYETVTVNIVWSTLEPICQTGF